MKIIIDREDLLEALERSFTMGKNTIPGADPTLHARNIEQSLLGRNKLQVIQVS